jgi:hypothetical protein
MNRTSLLGIGLGLLALGGCVAPAPDDASYESKAGMTAQAALSAARTAVLSTHSFSDGGLPGTYLEPVLEDAEQTLGSVRDTFDSVQPPATSAADDLRGALDPLLESASSDVTDLRIAARRGRSGDLASAADDLSGVADRLEAFGQEHGG